MLAITKAIGVVNQLKADGYISNYAVGGAVGALFYIEPTQTQDIDIFVHLNPAPGSVLVSLTPILDRLKELGFSRWDEDKVVVEGWPVQFLPATKASEIEAIDHAVSQLLADGVEAMVPPPEYLMVIAIELGRPKDILRLQQFHDEQVYDSEKLDALIKKHGLLRKWEKDLALFKSGDNS